MSLSTKRSINQSEMLSTLSKDIRLQFGTMDKHVLGIEEVAFVLRR